MRRTANINPKDNRVALDERCIQIGRTLVEALKARGHQLDGKGLIVAGERIQFRIYEPSRQTRVPLKRGEFGFRAGEIVTRQVLVPSGRLVLVAQYPAECSRERRWADKPGKPLERQVERIAVALEGLARNVVERRAEHERRDREFTETLRQAAARYRWDEEASEWPRRLHSLAADWQEAQQMSAFLGALEAHLAKHPSEALAMWLEWAREYVEGFNPFSSARMADLVTHAAILATPRVGEPAPNEEEWRALGMLDEYL